MRDDHSQHIPEPKAFWTTRYSLGLIVIGSIAGYFLLSEHRAHLFFALPYLLLLACLLMHVFMHHGHGRHGSGQPHQHDGQQRTEASAAPQANPSGEEP